MNSVLSSSYAFVEQLEQHACEIGAKDATHASEERFRCGQIDVPEHDAATSERLAFKRSSSGLLQSLLLVNRPFVCDFANDESGAERRSGFGCGANGRVDVQYDDSHRRD